ncbi:oxidative damage protection protein [Candidatus Ichthyocystis hellenicum]|uniref:oxidative damage protection protein n=1 Tax=Candidatus Ichthyocystis hellenicum TaxID=1561003 RepID=UPI000A5CBA8F|nr:oxidative damage protection protein [Candidatus Ichthyocystis hellenicum]
MRTVFCQKLKKEAKGLDFPPYPGAVGQRIFDNVSDEAWQMWLSHQTMLINEYRLSMADQRARQYLMNQMEKYLFSDDIVKTPDGYRPVDYENIPPTGDE